MSYFPLLLVCLAWASSGQRLQTSTENQTPPRALAAFLLGLESPAAFNGGQLARAYQPRSRLSQASPVMRYHTPLLQDERKAKYDEIMAADVAKLTSPEIEEWVALKHRKHRRAVEFRLKQLGAEMPPGYGERDQRRKFMRKLKIAKTVDEVLTPEFEAFVKAQKPRARDTILRDIRAKFVRDLKVKSEDWPADNTEKWDEAFQKWRAQAWGVVESEKTKVIKALKAAVKANTMEALDEAIAAATELEMDPKAIGELEDAQDSKNKLQEIEDAKNEAIEALKTATEGDDIAAIDEALEKAAEIDLYVVAEAEVKAAKQKKLDLEKAAAEAKKTEAIEALKTATEGDDIEAIDAAITAAGELGIDGPEMKAASKKKTELLDAKKKAEEEAAKAAEAAAEEAPAEEALAEEEKPAE
mmetsp:Transcript_157562/g.279419  ORF Transcript_157562/g.279419 Transcript_157562/m.279419 type:complete len:414 (-) Transcript_157562:94-1335(-)